MKQNDPVYFDWLNKHLQEPFTERDLKEVAFAVTYKNDFGHGTDGHNRLLILAKLYAIAVKLQNELHSAMEAASKLREVNAEYYAEKLRLQEEIDDMNNPDELGIFNLAAMLDGDEDDPILGG